MTRSFFTIDEEGTNEDRTVMSSRISQHCGIGDVLEMGQSGFFGHIEEDETTKSQFYEKPKFD